MTSPSRGTPPSESPGASTPAGAVATEPAIPFKISVLVYIFNDEGKMLLLHRVKPPNQDLYSPIGGKLEMATGESPYGCALREIQEEVGVALGLKDIRLLGIVSERAYPRSSSAGTENAKAAVGHWLMFCFEVTKRLNFPARRMNEGRLEWVDVAAVTGLEIPKTDREVIWPLVLEHSEALGGRRAGGYFSVHIDCRDERNVAVTQEHPLK
jgi:8-oxo-dGTP diphosphatase